MDFSSTGITIFGLQCTVQKLLVLLPSKKGFLVGHPYARDDVVLDQTTKRVSRGWDEVLVIRARNKPGFCSGDLRLCSKDLSAGKASVERLVRTGEMNVHLITIEVR